MRFAELLAAARIEGRLPRKAGEERRSERVLIGVWSNRPALPLLGRRIRGRQPGRIPELRNGVVGNRLRQAEVRQVGVRLPRSRDEQDVLRLDVAVDDATPVRPIEGPRDLREDPQRLVRVEATTLLVYELSQVRVAERGRQVERPALRSVIPDRQHVWVVGALGGRCLAPEPRPELRVAGELPAHHLHCGGAVVEQVDRLEHAAHASRADLAREPEAAADDIADAESAASQRRHVTRADTSASPF
jgi:hypothetical protein